MRITVTRAFMLRGERQEPGTVVEVPDLLGRELVALQKASPAAALAPQAGPMTTKSAPAVVAGAKATSTRTEP